MTGGAHLDQLSLLFRDIFVDQGFSQEAIRRRTKVELPGYYRATKQWDLVVTDRGCLVAAIEFKSQNSSVGNNFNNRIEEAIGSAVDLWQAYEHGLLGAVPPWLGYVFVFEESSNPAAPVRVARTPFQTDREFEGTSYRDRYQILFRRLVQNRLYDAVCFVSASAEVDAPINEPDPELNFATFVKAISTRAEHIRSLDATGEFGPLT